MQQRIFGRMGWQVGESRLRHVGHGRLDRVGRRRVARVAATRRRPGLQLLRHRLGLRRGHSERLLGELVRANPDTRLYRRDQDSAARTQVAVARGASARRRLSAGPHPRVRREEPGEPRARHRSTCIQFHVWEDAWARTTSWQRAVRSLKREGLVGAVGISINRWEPWNALRTLRTGLIDAVQVIYNIFDQAPEDELFPVCRELDIGGDRPRAVRRGHAHRQADQGQHAGPRATGATPTSCRRTCAERRAGRGAQAARARGIDDGGDGAALHSRRTPTSARSFPACARPSTWRRNRRQRRRPVAGGSVGGAA